MSSIHSLTPSITESAGIFFKNFCTKIGNLRNRVVVFFKNVPGHMQAHPMKVYVVANSLFYIALNFFTNYLLARLNRHPGKLENSQVQKDQQRLKNIFFRGLFTGITIFGFNLVLSKFTQFPPLPLGRKELSRIEWAVFTTTIIAGLRFLIDMERNLIILEKRIKISEKEFEIAKQKYEIAKKKLEEFEKAKMTLKNFKN